MGPASQSQYNFKCHSALPLAEIQLQWDTGDMQLNDPVLDQNISYRMDPRNIRHERLSIWPTLLPTYVDQLHIYNEVRATGLPNCMGARLPLHSTLNIQVWETLAKHTELDSVFLDYVKVWLSLAVYWEIATRLKSEKSFFRYKLYLAYK